MNYECKCVIKHNPAPRSLEAHYVIPVEWGGSPTSDNQVWVCPTTHNDIHALLDASRGKSPTKGVTNHYSVFVREAVQTGREGARSDEFPLRPTRSEAGWPNWCENSVDKTSVDM